MLSKLLFNLFIIFLFLGNGSSSVAEADSAAKRPPPPRRIPPNKVKPGGGLSYSQQSCHDADKSLIALVPVNNPVLTAKAHPSFLFYVPDPPAAISHGEFSILTADEKKRVYQTSIAIERTPGIIKIDLPPEERYALEQDLLYHWYFKIYCQDSSVAAKFLDVDGWIERVELTRAVEFKLANSSPDIWYDAIANEAEQIIADPQKSTQSKSWSKLMQYINLGHLTDIIIPINNIFTKDTSSTTKVE